MCFPDEKQSLRFYVLRDSWRHQRIKSANVVYTSLSVECEGHIGRKCDLGRRVAANYGWGVQARQLFLLVAIKPGSASGAIYRERVFELGDVLSGYPRPVGRTAEGALHGRKL